MTAAGDLAGAAVVIAVAVAAVHLRAEVRRQRAWLASMRRLARRCPSCGGLGLVVETPFGRDPTCGLCGGTGELPE